MSTLAYRLTIPGVGSVFAPGDLDPLPDTDFYITSKRCVHHPWIAQLGEDEEAGPDITADGQRIDPLTGSIEEGEIQIRVIDVPAPIITLQCDINTKLITEGTYGLDANAFTTGGWTR